MDNKTITDDVEQVFKNLSKTSYKQVTFSPYFMNGYIGHDGWCHDSHWIIYRYVAGFQPEGVLVVYRGQSQVDEET